MNADPSNEKVNLIERAGRLSDLEKRWFENLKEAFYLSDLVYSSDLRHQLAMREICIAIGVASRLRELLDQDTPSIVRPKHHGDKKRFIGFIKREMPSPEQGGLEVQLIDADTGKARAFEFADLIYAIRNESIHLFDTLNIDSKPDYHVTLKWGLSRYGYGGDIWGTSKVVMNAESAWWRLREILAKFITGINTGLRMARNESSFALRIDPPLLSIRSDGYAFGGDHVHRPD